VQIDFHHTVTYALARLAGFSHSDAVIIAYAAQYVDDAQNRGTVEFDNGQKFDRIASSHEIWDITNCQIVEDYQVWVPFHFLPGNGGRYAGEGGDLSLAQKLICTPDSPLATDVRNACFATRGERNSLHRLGITTHVYADTWAHKLFAGVYDPINFAEDISHSSDVYQNLLDEWKSCFVRNTVKVGHGAVLKHPDLPFLVWSYKNGYGQTVPRNNPQEFIEACDRTFELYVSYRVDAQPKVFLPRDRELIYESLCGFNSEDSGTRYRQWIDLISSGRFSFGALTADQARELSYAPKGIGSWKYLALGTTADRDEPNEKYRYSPSFDHSDWKLFHEALKAHQAAVLSLLPSYGIPTTLALQGAAV
jgi:hypothetical protein